MQIFIITFLSIKSLQNWAKTKPLHSIVPKFTRKSSPKNIRKFFSWSYFERIFNINGIRHVISTILHRKNVNFVIFFLYSVVTLIFVNKKKNIIPRNRLSFVLLFTSEWPATVMTISTICFDSYNTTFYVFFLYLCGYNCVLRTNLSILSYIPVFLHCVC